MAQRRMLTDTDREEISRGIVEDVEVRVIAARIGRSPSVVSREIARHGGRDGYRAVAAQRAATEARLRPKTRKIDADPVLRQRVVDKLRAGGSPDQVAGRLRYELPGQQAEWVSHEAIYTWIYALPKGELSQLGILLRTGRTQHRAHAAPGARSTGRTQHRAHAAPGARSAGLAGARAALVPGLWA